MLPFLIVAGLLVAWLAWTWNRLVALRAATRAAWASIDALLKRRTDLVPNLVAVVRGYMEYEADTLKQVVHARTGAMAAATSEAVADRQRAESLLGHAVQRLFALVERYPELRADQRIHEFQRQLVETENDIAMARRYYNAVVRDFNILCESFPTMLVAGALGFGEASYFELDSADDAAVPDADVSGAP